MKLLSSDKALPQRIVCVRSQCVSPRTISLAGKFGKTIPSLRTFADSHCISLSASRRAFSAFRFGLLNSFFKPNQSPIIPESLDKFTILPSKGSSRYQIRISSTPIPKRKGENFLTFEREEKGMGLLTNKAEREDLNPGDHIYTYRAVFAYSHHGVFVGGCKVVHFKPEHNLKSPKPSSSSSSSAAAVSKLTDSSEAPCPTYPDCGYKQPKSGVVLSCLDCFLNKGSLYRFEYGVNSSIFLTRFRSGTCTTASCDQPQLVIHRAMHLLQNGFGNYNIFQNNCEDFALYCKTGLLILDKHGVGRSGQASSILGAPLAALLSSPLTLLIPNPVGVATVTAGMYCMSRYATDIGVRSDVIKVPVEDLALNIGTKNH